MNRVIRFRVWDVNEKIMEGGYDITDAYFNYKVNRGKNDLRILMQFTGLYDKEGVEIYEGDILNGRNSIKKIVEFDNKRAAFVYIEQFKKPYKISFAQMYDKFKAVFYKYGRLPNHEVIGNIYQHPNLLIQ